MTDWIIQAIPNFAIFTVKATIVMALLIYVIRFIANVYKAVAELVQSLSEFIQKFKE